MSVKFNIEAGAENICAEEIMFPRFFNGTFENLRAFGKFTSDINIGRARV